MNAESPITVLLADDHAVVREGLCALLRMDGRFTIVGEACDGREAVAMARGTRPKVILMDVAMPELNGLEAVRQILDFEPGARVLILSAHSDDEYVRRALELGVAGFLEKQTTGKELVRAIREVAAGRVFFSPRILRRLREASVRCQARDGLPATGGVELTRRETEVWQLVAEGSANKRTAAALGISIKTVEKHRQQLMNKLNIHETAGLTRHAIATGLIAGGPSTGPG